MKKLMCIVLVVLFVPLSFLGCSTNVSKIITKDQYISQNELTENVTVTKIDISKIKNLDFLINMGDTTKINGVYAYNDEKHRTLILFNGIDGSYNDVKFSLKNNVLNINYKYNPLKGSNVKSLFMIEDTNKDGSYDKQILNNDGKKDSFVTIYGLSNIK
jgi:hypothetical protein